MRYNFLKKPAFEGNKLRLEAAYKRMDNFSSTNYYKLVINLRNFSGGESLQTLIFLPTLCILK